MNARLTTITLVVYVSIAMLIFFSMRLTEKETLKVAVFPRELTVNDVLNYSDSTQNATAIVWDFGNGNKKSAPKGSYQFHKEGNYIIRLFHNNQLMDTFAIVVKKPIIQYVKDTALTIYAPSTGIAGQYVHFKILGVDPEWCEWYFGESGKIDERKDEAFHAYNAPGTYEIKLVTNMNPKNPVYHKLRILPAYKIVDNAPLTDKNAAGGGGGNDLKEYIQRIADGGDFNRNYKYIIKTFLCNNAHIAVITNGKGGNDFYSYCQNLQLNPGIRIDNVVSEVDSKSNCINKLTITQH